MNEQIKDLDMFEVGTCDQCGKNTSVYYRPHAGQSFCSRCLTKSIERIINKTVSKYNMLSPDDKIIVGLSGGKDSIVLLYNLMKIQKKVYDAKPLIALSIDEGINGYRTQSIKSARKFCQRFGIRHEIHSFKEKVGKTLDELLNLKKSDIDFRYPCNYCALIRRRLLNDIAIELGGTVLALGHNLTDIAETFLMNILFKRFPLIAQQSPFDESVKSNTYYLKKIRPLMKLPEEEISIYIKSKKLDYYSDKCPYRKQFPILRKKVLNFIVNLKETSPETEFNLFNGFIELSEILRKEYKDINPNFCSLCGYPTSNYDICSYCQLVQEIK